MANQADAVGLAEQKAKNEDSGLTDLFGSDVLVGDDSEGRYNHFENLRCLSFKERLHKEKESLGLFLTGHLIDEYKDELKHFVDSRITDLRLSKDEQTVGGLIVNLRTMKSRKGETLAFVTIDDKSGRIEVSVFGELFGRTRDKLAKDEIIIVKGSTAADDFTGGIRMRANDLWTIEEARGRKVSRLKLEIDGNDLSESFADDLAELLRPFRSNDAKGCPVAIKYKSNDVQGDVILGDEWRVTPDDDLIQSLKEHYGPERVQLQYA